MFSWSASSKRFDAEEFGVKDWEEVRFRINVSRWPKRVLLGNGASASSWVPEFDRDKTVGEATGGDLAIARWSRSDSCENVEADRFSPMPLVPWILLSTDALLEVRLLPINGDTSSSLTGTAFSFGPSSGM
jgi:hypothetical protein